MCGAVVGVVMVTGSCQSEREQPGEPGRREEGEGSLCKHWPALNMDTSPGIHPVTSQHLYLTVIIMCHQNDLFQMRCHF